MVNGHCRDLFIRLVYRMYGIKNIQNSKIQVNVCVKPMLLVYSIFIKFNLRIFAQQNANSEIQTI